MNKKILEKELARAVKYWEDGEVLESAELLVILSNKILKEAEEEKGENN